MFRGVLLCEGAGVVRVFVNLFCLSVSRITGVGEAELPRSATENYGVWGGHTLNTLLNQTMPPPPSLPHPLPLPPAKREGESRKNEIGHICNHNPTQD